MTVGLLARLTVRRVFSFDTTDILSIIDDAHRRLPTESCLLFYGSNSGGATATPGRARSNDLAGRSTALAAPSIALLR